MSRRKRKKVARAIVDRLNGGDVRGLVEEFGCTEQDLYFDVPPFNPRNGEQIQRVRTKFNLIKVHGTIAVISTSYLDVPEPARHALTGHVGYIKLVRRQRKWRIRAIRLAALAT